MDPTIFLKPSILESTIKTKMEEKRSSYLVVSMWITVAPMTLFFTSSVPRWCICIRWPIFVPGRTSTVFVTTVFTVRGIWTRWSLAPTGGHIFLSLIHLLTFITTSFPSGWRWDLIQKMNKIYTKHTFKNKQNYWWSLFCSPESVTCIFLQEEVVCQASLSRRMEFVSCSLNKSFHQSQGGNKNIHNVPKRTEWQFCTPPVHQVYSKKSKEMEMVTGFYINK